MSARSAAAASATITSTTRIGQASPFADFTANYTSTGGIAGGEAGYNWQSGHYVVGVEGDLFWSGVKGNDAAQFNAGAFPGVGAVDATTCVGAARCALGAASRSTAGCCSSPAATLSASIQHTNTPPGGAVDQFNVQANGLTAGGGFAYAITDNVIGKFEYRYYDFDGYNRPNPPNGQIPYTTESTYSVVTVGLDFKFGGPVVAKY